MEKLNIIIHHRLHMYILKYKQTFALQHVTQHRSQGFSFLNKG